MRKTFLRLGSFLALLAVALGAFGAHILRSALSADSHHTFEIGVRYQFYHALAIIAVGILLYFRRTPMLPRAGWLFFGGVILFSGSLYLIALSEVLDFKAALLGPVTPIGGVLFMLGWAALLWSTYEESERAYRSRQREHHQAGQEEEGM